MSNHSRTEAQMVNTPLRKLRLADLQVQSFVTALDEHEVSQIAGGLWVWTRVSACFAESINLCENPSVYAQNHNC
jgi:hypothetical protein